jgi:hydrogenase nickel incorporation protein HypA/HybF
MHEFGLCEGVLAAVRQRAAGRPVAWVRVRAGVRHGVDAESMAQALQVLAEGSEAAGASLDLVTVPARLRCRTCGHTGQVHDLLALCPQCQGDDVEISGGDELTLESIGYASAGDHRAGPGDPGR